AFLVASELSSPGHGGLSFLRLTTFVARLADLEPSPHRSRRRLVGRRLVALRVSRPETVRTCDLEAGERARNGRSRRTKLTILRGGVRTLRGTNSLRTSSRRFRRGRAPGRRSPAAFRCARRNAARVPRRTPPPSGTLPAGPPPARGQPPPPARPSPPAADPALSPSGQRGSHRTPPEDCSPGRVAPASTARTAPRLSPTGPPPA